MSIVLNIGDLESICAKFRIQILREEWRKLSQPLRKAFRSIKEVLLQGDPKKRAPTLIRHRFLVFRPNEMKIWS